MTNTDPIGELRAIRSSLTPLESEALTAKIIAILDVTQDGIIELASPPADALFGYCDGELVGMVIHELIPERDGIRDRHRQHFARFWKDPTPRAMGIAVTGKLIGRRKNGTEFAVAITLYPYVRQRIPRCRAIVVPLP